MAIDAVKAFETKPVPNFPHRREGPVLIVIAENKIENSSLLESQATSEHLFTIVEDTDAFSKRF